MALFDTEHTTIPLGKNHRVHDLEFANAAARAAHTYVADDVGKEYRDLDTNTWWRLVSQAAGVGTFRESAAAGGGGGGGATNTVKTDTTTLTFGSSSTLALFTTAAGEIITLIQVFVTPAFDGTPSVSIGIAGTVDKYAATTDIDLTTAATYEIVPGLPAGGVEALIATYSAGGASVGSARIVVHYTLPS